MQLTMSCYRRDRSFKIIPTVTHLIVLLVKTVKRIDTLLWDIIKCSYSNLLILMTMLVTYQGPIYFDFIREAGSL